MCVDLPCQAFERLCVCVVLPCDHWRHWSKCCSTQSTPGQGHLCCPENHPRKKKEEQNQCFHTMNKNGLYLKPEAQLHFTWHRINLWHLKKKPTLKIYSLLKGHFGLVEQLSLVSQGFVLGSYLGCPLTPWTFKEHWTKHLVPVSLMFRSIRFLSLFLGTLWNWRRKPHCKQLGERLREHSFDTVLKT